MIPAFYITKIILSIKIEGIIQLSRITLHGLKWGNKQTKLNRSNGSHVISNLISGRSNALEALDNLLKKGAKPNVTSSSKSRTPLHVAAQFGHKQIIERLLNVKNLDIDATDQQGMTALHLAISRGYEDICTDLIDNGASINMTTKEGLSCLHLAADAGNTEIVSLVIQTGRYGHNST